MGSKAGISCSSTGKVNISGRNRGGNKGWTGTSVGKSVREEALEDHTFVDPQAHIKRF